MSDARNIEPSGPDPALAIMQTEQRKAIHDAELYGDGWIRFRREPDGRAVCMRVDPTKVWLNDPGND